jgi:hypothetical protein
MFNLAFLIKIGKPIVSIEQQQAFVSVALMLAQAFACVFFVLAHLRGLCS